MLLAINYKKARFAKLFIVTIKDVYLGYSIETYQL